MERDVAPGEPAVIRRLPDGADYTPIKMIFADLPSGLPTLLWAARSDSNPGPRNQAHGNSGKRRRDGNPEERPGIEREPTQRESAPER